MENRSRFSMARLLARCRRGAMLAPHLHGTRLACFADPSASVSSSSSRRRCGDIEGALRPTKRLTVKGNVGWNDAPYRDFVTDIDGTPTQLAGHYQVLTPSMRAGGGVFLTVAHGWQGSFTSNWIGRHWLNSLNTFQAPSYNVIDASFGYRFDRLTLAILASNLTNRRDAVQQSEMGEGQFYRLPARRVDATLTWHYK
jgi:outer membrane receptor protein involved in Fe transport